MTKGCYWCKNRRGFECKLDSRIELREVLARLGRPHTQEKALSWIITATEDNMCEGQYIGEDCCVKKEQFIFR